MRRTVVVKTFALLLLASSSLSAQSWEMPTFHSPRPGEDIGIYVIRPEGVDDLGFAAIWRMEGNLNLGVRGGYAQDYWSLGAEFYRPIPLGTDGLLVSGVAGLGASFNGATMLRVPLGVSVGLAFGSPGGVQLLPYAHPRVALDVLAYNLPDGREQTDTDVRFEIDLGADARLGDAFVVRVGATLGDANTFGAGLAYRFSRRLIVR